MSEKGFLFVCLFIALPSYLSLGVEAPDLIRLVEEPDGVNVYGVLKDADLEIVSIGVTVPSE